MPTGRQLQVAIKKESTFNTYVTGDLFLRPSSEELKNNIKFVEDEAMVGETFSTEQIKTGEDPGGTMQTALHGDTAGVLLHACLGGETSVTNPAKSYLVVNYTGTALYARLTKASTNLTAETSADGSSWSVDNNFGSSGVVDLTAAAYDTAAELSSAIDGFTGWDSTLFGASATPSTGIAAFSATVLHSNDVKNTAMLLPVLVTSTVSKTHTVYPADVGTNLPSYSITLNRGLGTNASISYTGSKLSSLNITTDQQGIVKAALTWNCCLETTGKNDITYVLPTVQTFIASKTTILMDDDTGDQIDFANVKSLGINVNANVDSDFSIGSYYKNEQVAQKGDIDVSFTATLTTTQNAVRPLWVAGTSVSMWVYMESNSIADLTNSIPYSLLIRLPRVKLMDFNAPSNTPDRIVITGSGKVEKPQNAVIPKHIYAYITDTDTTVYTS
jgi:hypothetical protein